jgi:5-formyltetrahydrofolate cyclo-ligase
VGVVTSRPASAIELAKRELREQMNAVTRAIGADPAERVRRSDRLAEAMIAVCAAAADEGRPYRVMVFEALRSEPDLAGFDAWCRQGGAEVFGPSVVGDALRVDPGDVDPLTLDLVVVPGRAFTPDGRRLGRGGGHYDRFLLRLAPGCRTIGVCYAEQVVGDLPVADHDVPVDVVVTDAGLAGDHTAA